MQNQLMNDFALSNKSVSVLDCAHDIPHDDRCLRKCTLRGQSADLGILPFLLAGSRQSIEQPFMEHGSR